MYKVIALMALLCVTGLPAWAQSESTTTAASGVSSIDKPSRDFFMLQLTYDGWAGTPDSVKTEGFNRGVGTYLCYDFPIKKSHMSVAIGLGVTTSNMYFKNQRIILNDTGAAGNNIHFTNEDPSKNYNKYKMATTYIEAPIELRYFGNKENRNKGFKAAIGVRVGNMVSNHTKGVYKVTGSGSKITDKESTKRYLESWRIAGTLRLGYGNFTVIGTYNFTNLFKSGAGPGVTPYSIGIAITGL